MKISVIGAGKWGANLVRTLSQMNALESVVEKSTQIRETLQKNYPQLRVYSDIEELFQSSPSAVVIATPVPTHYSVAKECLKRNLHVFVEKPLTMNTHEARELVQLAKEKNRILMVGHLLLYQPAIQWIKKTLSEGKLGEIYSLHQERLNLGKAREVENALWSLGVHDVAVLLYLIGKKPKKILSTGQRALRTSVEDDVTLHLFFENNIQAHLHNSWLWPEKRRVLTVVGEKGMLVYDEIDQKVFLHKKGITKDRSNRDEGVECVFEGEGEPLRLEMNHFLDCIQSSNTPFSDGQSGLEVIEVLEEASNLIQQGVQEYAF